MRKIKFTLPEAQIAVLISEKQKKEIEDLISRITDLALNDPIELDLIIAIGEILLSENGLTAIDVNIVDKVLEYLLDKSKESKRLELLEIWVLIRDSVTKELEDDHNCCGCEHCEHHNPEP